MVDHLKKQGYIQSLEVERAMLKVRREAFLPPSALSNAYEDRPLPIGTSQTISAPHMNAMMCELLALSPGLKLLELGTGSGYHAALCAEILAPGGELKTGHIYTIERHPNLASKARDALQGEGYGDFVMVFVADGTRGCARYAPFDRILVTAAAPFLPPPLADQLAEGGIIVIPLGKLHYSQALFTYTKREGKLIEKRVCGVAFVPLVGEYGHPS